MGSIFFISAQGSKLRQENRDQWVPDIPCYDPAMGSNPVEVPQFFYQVNLQSRLHFKKFGRCLSK